MDLQLSRRAVRDAKVKLVTFLRQVRISNKELEDNLLKLITHGMTRMIEEELDVVHIPIEAVISGHDPELVKLCLQSIKAEDDDESFVWNLDDPRTLIIRFIDKEDEE